MARGKGLAMLARSYSLPVMYVPNVSRGTECRRNGLGNIFQGLNEIPRGKVFTRTMSICGGDSVAPAGHSIRFNLTSGDFEFHDELYDKAEDDSPITDDRHTFDGDYPVLPERELNTDTSVSRDKGTSFDNLDQTVFNTRRLALADIFANVENNLLLELLAVYSGASVNESGLHKKTRRNGVANIYENINETDLKMFLSDFEGHFVNGHISEGADSSSDDMDDEVEQTITCRRSRRNALADIYDGVERHAVQSIAGEIDEIEEEAKMFDYQSRRRGLANIKENVSKIDISRLKDICSEMEIDTEPIVRCRERRPAMGDIYSELDTEEVDGFLKQFTHSEDTDSD